jgi:thymidylate synthase (FAD)
MHIVEPKVFLIGETDLHLPGLEAMLEEIGSKEYFPAGSDGGDVIEVAGRLCYRSFEPGLNKNVTKVREGNKQYIENILKSHHGSVLEHGTVSFALLNVSRIFTHEICRHRAGVAISQESMRYVRMDDIPIYIPDLHEVFNQLYPGEGSQLAARYWQSMQRVAEFAEREMASYNALLDKEGVSFEVKKKITSALRRMAPSGHTTNIIVTANHRAWRHILELRTSPGAEEEMVKVMRMVGEQLLESFPTIYQDADFAREVNSIQFTHSKV